MGLNYGSSYGTFGVLNTAYSGLQVSQSAIGVVSHNISNAENEGYTRQRINIQARAPINANYGDLGTGAMVYNVQRVHDEFLYKKYTSASNSKEFTDFEKNTLEEISKYFPDIQDSGIAKDLQNYYEAWQSYANSPADTSQAIALAQKADVLSTNINDTIDRLKQTQRTLNDQLTPLVDEINRIGQEIANLNAEITEHESNGQTVANDLRDRRDTAELSLNRLVNVEISKTTPLSNISIDPNLYDKTQKYVIEIGGMPLVDGKNFHPIVIKQDPKSGSNQFDTIYFEFQDYSLKDISYKLQGGKVGAIIDLRGANIDQTGEPTTGKIQSYIDTLNSFANGLIEHTNNIYASSAVSYMKSNEIDTLGNETLQFLPLNIQSGSFDAIVYDTDGNEVARKTIDVDIDGDTLSDIMDKMNLASDDNEDGNATNDFASYFTTGITTGEKGSFQILGNSIATAKGYTFAIKDNSDDPTNFAGALGLSRFFDGTKGTNMSLNYDLAQEPTNIRAYGAPVIGNNDMANSMIQLQYDQVDFRQRSGAYLKNTISGTYNNLNTLISTDTNTAGLASDSSMAVYNNVQAEFDAVSKVSIDEELINLVKFQAGYGAAAKCVTTIDQMINTLLGIKQ